jgi:type IV pilus assembly protein PilA
MLARIRKAQEGKESGFTLIELLVVMIIIGILAAIAIPAFLNQKNKAKETSAKADVSTIGKEIAAYYVDNTGALSVNTVTGPPLEWTLSDAVPTVVARGKLSAGNQATGTITSDAAYCVSVKNADAPQAWKYDQNGLAKGTC